MSSIQQTKAAVQAIHLFLAEAPKYIRAVQHYQIDLNTTYTKCNDTYGLIESLNMDMGQVVQSWNNITSSPEDAIAELYIRALVTELDNAQDTLKRLQSSASDLKSNSTHVEAELNDKLKQLQAELKSENQQINQLNQEITEAVKNINKINDDLSGASGFWEGLKTGLTFGIYSGLRDKLKLQKSLYHDYKAKLAQRKSAYNTINSDAQAIQQVQPALNTATYLYNNLTPLQNTLNDLLELVKDTEHDGDKVISTTKMKVADFYRKYLNTKMQELLAWQDAFSV